MSILPEFEYEGIRWGYAFTKTDSRLNDGQRVKLLVEAVDMFFEEERERFITGENYAGTLSTNGEYVSKGFLNGQRFNAELFIEGVGEANLEFFVNEQTTGAPGSSSLN